MSHNGMLASNSALRNFSYLLTKEAMEYVCQQMGFKSLNSLHSRLNGIVACNVNTLRDMISHYEYFKLNVSNTFVGTPVEYDAEQSKHFYMALMNYIGTKDYNTLSSKKKVKIYEEQKRLNKQLRNN